MKVRTMSGIANEFVVASEYILSASNILVEAKKDGTLRCKISASATLGTALGTAPTALGSSDDLFLFVWIRCDLHRHLEVVPGRRQTFQQGGVVAHPG